MLWAQTRPEKIVFSIPSRSIAAIDLYVAKERGFFRDEGLDVDIVQIRGNVAVAAALSGQVQATNGVGTVIRALERSEIPLKILTVSLKRNLFWLVARKEITSIAQLKGQDLGHDDVRRLAAYGRDPSDTQRAASIRIRILRWWSEEMFRRSCKVWSAESSTSRRFPRRRSSWRVTNFNMNVLGSAMEDLSNLQNGTAVTEKFLRENRDLLKRILRARAKANRYFWENERGTSEVLAKFQNVDLAVARESYRLAKPAFTLNGIPSPKEIEEFLKADAELLKLKEPVAAAKIFDFSLAA